jgi:hypothetical protein
MKMKHDWLAAEATGDTRVHMRPMTVGPQRVVVSGAHSLRDESRRATTLAYFFEDSRQAGATIAADISLNRQTKIDGVESGVAPGVVKLEFPRPAEYKMDVHFVQQWRKTQ